MKTKEFAVWLIKQYWWLVMEVSKRDLAVDQERIDKNKSIIKWFIDHN